ncbi:hypothetical protein RFI_29641 [Reticulomyxa filosa]|uniref:Transmembrane protein n=1 Tax=Reticulomyxa filosa TaxID=46433 RepID=X6M1I6_RETFI|nr:hypothetical protein RFI_29641 [Reticulomyxa filosa]|eukprot:ETO07749.1 hypothetical protein RFI_29641 [Reticulomyxa filosa]
MIELQFTNLCVVLLLFPTRALFFCKVSNKKRLRKNIFLFHTKKNSRKRFLCKKKKLIKNFEIKKDENKQFEDKTIRIMIIFCVFGKLHHIYGHKKNWNLLKKQTTGTKLQKYQKLDKSEQIQQFTKSKQLSFFSQILIILKQTISNLFLVPFALRYDENEIFVTHFKDTIIVISSLCVIPYNTCYQTFKGHCDFWIVYDILFITTLCTADGYDLNKKTYNLWKFSCLDSNVGKGFFVFVYYLTLHKQFFLRDMAEKVQLNLPFNQKMFRCTNYIPVIILNFSNYFLKK